MYSLEIFTCDGDSCFDGETYDSQRDALLRILNLLNDCDINRIALIETHTGEEIETFK